MLSSGGQGLWPLIHPAGEPLRPHRLRLQFDELWPDAELLPPHARRDSGRPGLQHLRKALVVSLALLLLLLSSPNLLIRLTPFLVVPQGGL